LNMMQGKGKNSTQTPRGLVRTYIRAKDENRPHLTARVFSETAELEIIVKPGTISFPSLTKGLKSITDVLVRSFSVKYENIYTFCLKRPKPQTREKGFSCDWLVGMSEREGGHVRVGCGRYDWRFFPGERYLVDRLVITIEVMQVLAPVWNKTVFEWLSGLPYPWCPRETIAGTAPVIEGIEAVTDYITRFSLSPEAR
jgi:hypothetical protein